MVPLRESSDHGRSHWLLVTVAYELVNSNAKSQVQYDQHLHDLDFCCDSIMPQLFLPFRNGHIVARIANIVEDLLIPSLPEIIPRIMESIHTKLEVGTIARRPGHLRQFRIKIVQHTEHAASSDADDQLLSIAPMKISPMHCSEQLSPLSSIEPRSFDSVKPSIGCIGTTASPFCAQFASRMQQRGHFATVAHLLS